MKKRERKKCNCSDEYEDIKKIIAYMEFATKLKMAQEDIKKQRQKESDK